MNHKIIFFKCYDSLLQVPFCEDESVQLFRVAFFRSDFFQNPYFNGSIEPDIFDTNVALGTNGDTNFRNFNSLGTLEGRWLYELQVWKVERPRRSCDIKAEDQKCRILSLIIAQIAVLILASIGRDALAQKSDVISALSNSGEWHEKIRRLELILFIIKAPILKDKRKRHFMIYEVFGCVNLYNVCSAILIVEFEDTICRYTSKISLYFKKIIQGWSLLFDKPIVWPATQLVPTMDQMLAGPGTK